MTAFPHGTKSVLDTAHDCQFSVCTLVTKPDQYGEMVASFRKRGFTDGCEFLYVDNSQGNVLDGFSGVNRFLTMSRGKYVILAHQDVLLVDDGRAELEKRLAELSKIDPLWAVCGNAGVDIKGQNTVRISDPYGKNQRIGTFPSTTSAMDENFIVVRREANLGVAATMTGFHFYASDICLNAANLGMRAYVIDFHLLHKGSGTKDAAYYAAKWKWVAFRGSLLGARSVATTSHQSIISKSKAAILAYRLICRNRLAQKLGLPRRIVAFLAKH